jgi:aryl-alcohol dehydrogenase-like predicted oxidoreductase
MNKNIDLFSVFPIGLGTSYNYGVRPTSEEIGKLLTTAYDNGIDFFDTAAMYNTEIEVGRYLPRSKIILASKGGLTRIDGVKVIDNLNIRRDCEASLRRLNTDVIDLYYLHRWDKVTPIEDIVGIMSDLVREGKIRAIGLSEVSSATIQRAHAVHPITALQSEYSLWTRNSNLEICQELGIRFVAFSPLARGFFGGEMQINRITDLRHHMPRFIPENYQQNLSLLERVQQLADNEKCTTSQLSLAWLMLKKIIPIPGTTKPQHIIENIASIKITLSEETIKQLDLLGPAIGERYNEQMLKELDVDICSNR